MVGLNVNHPIRTPRCESWTETNGCLTRTPIFRPNGSGRTNCDWPNPRDKYTFELRDERGAVLLRQTEDEYDWTPVRGRSGGTANYLSHTARRSGARAIGSSSQPAGTRRKTFASPRNLQTSTYKIS